MDFFTHLIFGVLLYNLFLGGVTYDYIFLASFFSILPDLDVFLSPLRRVIKSNYLEHRAGSHSYIIGIILSAIIGIFYSAIRQKPFLIVWLIGMLFYGLHVSMDLLTTTKIPYLYPLSKKEHSFYVEKAGSLFTMLCSLCFIILTASLNASSVNFNVFKIILNAFTGFYISYYIYRIATRIWFGLKLKDNQKYFPGVLPFSYAIYNHGIEGNEISLSIERRFQFSKKKETVKSNTALNAEEMDLFERGLALCNKVYYYAKWTKFPIFIRDEEIFSIRLFFLETMMRRRTMYIQFDFGMLTEQVVGISRKSGPIQI